MLTINIRRIHPEKNLLEVFTRLDEKGRGSSTTEDPHPSCSKLTIRKALAMRMHPLLDCILTQSIKCRHILSESLSFRCIFL
jgi:vacuolar-type H+-ATPase subunit B/Vma2